jgi:hypothetical protein
MTQHLGSLRCRWGGRIAPNGAFAVVPGECLKSETGWRSLMQNRLSLLCGKKQGISRFPTHDVLTWRHRIAEITLLFQKIPWSSEQGNFGMDQGIQIP